MGDALASRELPYLLAFIRGFPYVNRIDQANGRMLRVNVQGRYDGTPLHRRDSRWRRKQAV